MIGEEEEGALIHTVRKRQTKWIGHMLRGVSLLRTVIEGKMKGKRTRGRPRQMMLSSMFPFCPKRGRVPTSLPGIFDVAHF